MSGSVSTKTQAFWGN